MREFITIVEAASRPSLSDDSRSPSNDSLTLTNDQISTFAQEIQERLNLKAFLVHLAHGGDIKLASIIAGDNGQGRGTAAMEALCAFADAHRARIILTPGQPDDRHGTTSTARLKRFYKRFGFIENTGRRKDFSISATMLREPR